MLIEKIGKAEAASGALCGGSPTPCLKLRRTRISACFLSKCPDIWVSGCWFGYFCCWQGSFFPPFLGFLTLVSKLVAEHHQIPPNAMTVSQPVGPRPSHTKVCGQVRVNVLPSTSALPPPSPTAHPGFAGRGMLPAARWLLLRRSRSHSSICRCSAQAVPAQSSAPRSVDFQPGYIGHAGLVQAVAVWPFPSGSCPWLRHRGAAPPGCPTVRPTTRCVLTLRPPNSLNQSVRSFLSSFRSSLETGFH